MSYGGMQPIGLPYVMGFKSAHLSGLVYHTHKYVPVGVQVQNSISSGVTKYRAWSAGKYGRHLGVESD
jgi:hypothetical protein